MSRGLFVLLCLIPVVAPAQVRDTTPVPRELVTALLGFEEFLPGIPTILVRATPSGFPTRIIPSGGLVLGSLDAPPDARRGQWGRERVVIRFQESPESVSKAWAAHMETLGWKAPPPYEPGPRGGFAMSTPGGRGHGQFCTDSASVMGRTQPRPDGGAYLHLSYSSTRRNTMCDERVRDRMGHSDNIALTTLRPPMGVSGGSSGGGSGTDHADSRARLYSEMSALTMANHFLEQLQADGWRLVTRFGDGAAALITVRKRDASGRELFGALVDIQLGQREHDLLFRVSVPARP